jgi:hypothetical protein
MIEAPPRAVRYTATGLALLSALVAFTTWNFRLAGSIKDGVFLLFGGFLLVVGFVRLCRKRMIENLPSSRVRSVAMGLAELVGRVRQRTPVRAPLSGTLCSYFRYTIEKETGGKNRRWEVVERGESSEPFWLEDDTGRILVQPAGADPILRTAFRETRRHGGVFSTRWRYTEQRLVDGQRIYVLGTVGRARDAARERQEALAGRLRDLKRDADRLRAFDADADGRIDGAEWGAAVASVKDDLLRDSLERPRDPSEDVAIGKGGAEDTFVIADRGEASILNHLKLQVAIALFLGVIFTLVPAVSLLARAGALPRGLAIDWNTTFIDVD